MKRYLIAGLLVWVPLGVTAMVINFGVGLMDKTLLWLPERYQPDNLLGFHVPGLGVVLSVVIVLVTGIMVYASTLTPVGKHDDGRTRLPDRGRWPKRVRTAASWNARKSTFSKPRGWSVESRS